MARYTCPRCRTPLDVPDHAVGAEAPCPRCRLRLLFQPPPATPRPEPLPAPPPGAEPPAPPAPPRPAPGGLWGELSRRVSGRPAWWQGLRPEARTGLLALSIALASGVALVLLALAITAPEVVAYLVGAAVSALLALGLVAGLVALIVWSLSIGTECPRCGRRWARVLLHELVVEEKKCYGLVTRHAHSSSSGWASGTSSRPGAMPTYHQSHSHGSGTTTWQERVPVVRTTYLQHFACKHCAAKWTGTRVQQVEDFDVPR